MGNHWIFVKNMSPILLLQVEGGCEGEAGWATEEGAVLYCGVCDVDYWPTAGLCDTQCQKVSL